MGGILSRHLEVDGLNNTRDLGGMQTKDGRTIKSGKLIRSGKLHVLKDTEWLAENVSLVIDLRSSNEVTETPDPVPEGVEFLHLPIFEMRKSGVTRDRESDRGMVAMTPETALQRMAGVYVTFLTNDYSRSQFARLVRLLLEPREKAVLWHCYAGKDRTGTAAIFIQEILGVAKEDILADYMISGEYLADELREQVAERGRQTGSMDETQEKIMRCFIDTHIEYPEIVYKTAEDNYGSFDDFIREGLGITDEERETLRRMYLEA